MMESAAAEEDREPFCQAPGAAWEWAASAVGLVFLFDNSALCVRR